MVEVEVVYAAVDHQVLRVVAVEPGSSVRAAVLSSGIALQFAQLDLASCPLGIFGKVVPDTRVVQAGDRIEIYRPLLADPMEIRRLRAAKAAKARAQSS